MLNIKYDKYYIKNIHRYFWQNYCEIHNRGGSPFYQNIKTINNKLSYLQESSILITQTQCPNKYINMIMSIYIHQNVLTIHSYVTINKY